MMEWMDSMVAVRRSGFWDSALPASTPITSRQRIFSLNSRESFVWVGVYKGWFWRRLLGFGDTWMEGDLSGEEGLSEEMVQREECKAMAPAAGGMVVESG